MTMKSSFHGLDCYGGKNPKKPCQFQISNDDCDCWQECKNEGTICMEVFFIVLANEVLFLL